MPKYEALQFIYNSITTIAEKVLPVTSIFSEKMKLFVEGRKNVFPVLRDRILPKDKTVWFHAASLGEYEQAVPIIELVKNQLPGHKIIVSFFSPSGYEIKKNSKLVDVVTYLPIDTAKNANKFLDITHPEWVFFIKYEFWPNYLRLLNERNIKSLLISGNFRKDQIFFKSYGKWMRSYLQSFDHFFVQNEGSKALLGSIGFNNVTLSGDTRFDRVSQQIEQDNTLDFIAEFKNNKCCVVAGSTWTEDEDLLVDFINRSSEGVKFIIAPHVLKPQKMQELLKKLKPKSLFLSEKEAKELSDYQVLIVDNIGMLSKIYSYADIAYVGGALGTTGLHNILEPATFGVPIITGPNILKFPEALKLQQLAGLYTVTDADELRSVLLRFIQDKDFRIKTGMICDNFVNENKGATKIISEYLLLHS